MDELRLNLTLLTNLYLSNFELLGDKTSKVEAENAMIPRATQLLEKLDRLTQIASETDASRRENPDSTFAEAQVLFSELEKIVLSKNFEGPDGSQVYPFQYRWAALILNQISGLFVEYKTYYKILFALDPEAS